MHPDSFSEVYSKFLAQLEKVRALEAQRLREWDVEFQQLEKISDADHIRALEELAELLYEIVLNLVRGSVPKSLLSEARKTLSDQLFSTKSGG